MIARHSFSILAALVMGSAANAAAVASLSCTGSQGPVNINLSYFAVGATLTTPASGSTPTQNNVLPLSLHAALGSFETLFQAVATGIPFTSCVLNTSASNGSPIQFTFSSVYVTSATAVATSSNALAPRTAYVDAALLYSAVSVTQAGSTVDDGGTSTPPGWDIGIGTKS